MKTVYLDNAATSFPKCEGVAEAMTRYITQVGASINRGVYGAAQDAGMTALELREALCRLFGHGDPTCCVLTSGNTYGLNQIIRGLLRPGDHCLVSAVEHNSVMRPLTELAREGVEFDRIPCGSDGRLDPSAIPALLRPQTKLVLIAHASNVSGAIQDAAAVGRICREHGVPFALDAAQTAGHVPIDFAEFGLSALSVPGHKGLLGPSGIGALLLEPSFAARLTPIVTGGTGSASDEEIQPNYMPDRFESGTHNLPGIYGLKAAADYILSVGVENLHRRVSELTAALLDLLRPIEGIRIVGPDRAELNAGVVSVDFLNVDNAVAAYRLESEYGVLTRCGLHCAPNAHKTLGTFPNGTVRFSPGCFTTEAELAHAAKAVAAIA